MALIKYIQPNWLYGHLRGSEKLFNIAFPYEGRLLLTHRLHMTFRAHTLTQTQRCGPHGNRCYMSQEAQRWKR